MSTQNAKTILIALAFCIGALPFSMRAESSLHITEIMYDVSGTDADHEWIEIQNSGSSPITLVGGTGTGSYRFNDGSNHVFASTPAHGSFTIPAQEFFIIAGNADVFMTDNPTFTGTVIDTTMSLGNDGDTVKIIDGDGNILDSVTYTSTQGASGDGNSLQRTSDNTWISATPTIGTGTTSSTSTTTDTGGGSTQKDTSTKAVDIPTLKGVLTMSEQGMSHIPVSFKVELYGYDGSPRSSGVYHISFGDGAEYTPRHGEDFQHTYDYSGEYIVTFSYKSSVYMKDTEFLLRKSLSILEPHISISTISNDGSITISNPTDVDTDISGWILKANSIADSHEFTFPRDMFVQAGRKIVFSKNVTGFVVPIEEAVLLLPDGTVVSQLNIHKSPANTSRVPVVSTTVSLPTISQKENQVTEVGHDIGDVSATVIDAVPTTKNTQREPLYLFIVGLVGIIGIGIFAMRYYNVTEPDTTDALVQDVSDTKKIADAIRIISDEE